MSPNELRERLAVIEQANRDRKDWLVSPRYARLPDEELEAIFAAVRMEVQRRIEQDENEIVRICETLRMMEEVMA